MDLRIPLLALLLSAAVALSAQHCSNDSLSTYPPGDFNYTGSGFAEASTLPCLQIGAYSEVILPFKTYEGGARNLMLADSSTVPVSRIYSIRVDNVTGLPSGTCWTTRASSGTV